MKTIGGLAMNIIAKGLTLDEATDRQIIDRRESDRRKGDRRK